MPEYDPVNYPKPNAPDLTDSEVGRDTVAPGSGTGGEAETLRAWPPSPGTLPERYAGPPPSREWDAYANTAHVMRAAPVPAVAPPADAPAPEKSIAPPPGHTAQP